MTFAEAVRTCFQKYVTIEGRAQRSEYWWFFLFGFVGNALLGAVDSVVLGDDIALIAPLFSIAIFLPLICAAIRRLHDRDMSGWWVLLNLIPLFGFIILVVIYALPGTNGANRFGPDPLGPLNDEGDDDGSYVKSSIPRAGHE